jgi:hypothetical protein
MAAKKQNKSRISTGTYTTRFLLIFAAISTAICFAYIFLITFAVIPKGNERYADICLGFILGTFLATIVQFFYGSAHTSKEKDSALEGITAQYKDAMAKLATISSIASPSEEPKPEESETENVNGVSNERGQGADDLID